MSNKIKPCPFCGGDSYVTEGDLFAVICFTLTCDASGPARDTEAEAIRAWNRRAISVSDATKVVNQDFVNRFGTPHETEHMTLNMGDGEI